MFSRICRAVEWSCLYFNYKILKYRCLIRFGRIRKYPIDKLHFVDFDNMLDWKIAEIMLKDKLVEI